MHAEQHTGAADRNHIHVQGEDSKPKMQPKPSPSAQALRTLCHTAHQPRHEAATTAALGHGWGRRMGGCGVQDRHMGHRQGQHGVCGGTALQLRPSPMRKG